GSRLAQAPQSAGGRRPAGRGWGAGIRAAGNRHWLFRILCVAVGLGLAAGAWWFVPALGGMNLWTAEHEGTRLLAELETMPIGDGKAYQANLAAREAIVTQFPAFENRFEGPAKTWLVRSLDQWEKDLARLPAGNLAGLEELRSGYDPFLSVGLESAELAWFERTYAALKPGDFKTARTVRAHLRKHEFWAKQTRSWEEAWA